MYGCQQNLISDKEITPFLEFLCGEANNLVNCGIYLARQLLFKANYLVKKYDLEKELKSNIHYQFLCAQAAQQTLRGVAESFESYKQLREKQRQGELHFKPKPPNYRKSGGMATITYPKQAIRLKENKIRIPLGRRVKAAFGIDSFTIPMPSNLDFAQINEVRILPRNRCFYAEFVYEKRLEPVEVDKNNVLGIDPGINNWITCVSNVGTSFIVDGKHLKSINKWYNKKVSAIKEKKPQGFWSNKLADLTEKRNRQMRDAINKAARIVINHCIQKKIGVVVFGWNDGQRQNINLGKKTNQSFVQIPTAKLKARIAQLCEQYGLDFVETEESYTSQSSFLDGDELPKYGEKPTGWKPAGKRTKRGLYRTAKNWYIHADCQGAANIIKKVSRTLGFNLDRLSRGVLTRPHRIKLWSAKQTQSNAVLTRCVVSV